MANILKETVRGVEAVRIEDELLKNREIFLVDEVNPESCNELFWKMRTAAGRLPCTSTAPAGKS